MNEWMELNILARRPVGTFFCLHEERIQNVSYKQAVCSAPPAA